MANIELRNIAISGFVVIDEDDDDDKILEILNEIKGIELPAKFASQLVNVTKGNLNESALIFSDGLPEGPVTPKSSIELIAITVDDDKDISFSMSVSPSLVDSTIKVLDTILSLEECHVTGFDLEYTIEQEFLELVFAVDGPEEFDYKGVKFGDGTYDYIVQSSPSGSWDDDDGEMAIENFENDKDNQESKERESEDDIASVSVMTIEHFTVDDSADFINERIQNIDETIESIVP